MLARRQRLSPRGAACFWLSKAMMARNHPSVPATDAERYNAWRSEEMERTWSHFPQNGVDGKDVLDFGCGAGPLSLYLAKIASPRSIVGVDLYAKDLERAQVALSERPEDTLACQPDFRLGEPTCIPVGNQSVDVILAMDCMEHVMNPLAIMAEWRRVLRPDGRVLLAWSPFAGPWGAHMQTLLPVPWAHILFGERAVFEAAERMYDDPDYIPQHWDYDESGRRKPNQFRRIRRFRDGAYLNQIDIASFRRISAAAGLEIARLDAQPFGASGLKRIFGRALLKLPFVRAYCTSFIVGELVRRS